MDCAADEQMVRDALDDVTSIRRLEFDLPGRRLAIYHDGAVDEIAQRLHRLGLGSNLESSQAAAQGSEDAEQASDRLERRTLLLLLGINAMMFAVEQISGWLASSAGLLSDSLDMFADASIYGVALYAVGRSRRLKRRAAALSGWLQLALAFGVLAEVVRRFAFGSAPDPAYMMAVAVLALAANAACLFLIAPHRARGVHMTASWIFSTNDVIANIGVIVAGALVAWTGSRFPDLVVGTMIAAVVVIGAVRILRLR